MLRKTMHLKLEVRFLALGLVLVAVSDSALRAVLAKEGGRGLRKGQTVVEGRMMPHL